MRDMMEAAHRIGSGAGTLHVVIVLGLRRSRQAYKDSIHGR
jgi:hypothetical protein